jgi:hypothetical protein
MNIESTEEIKVTIEAPVVCWIALWIMLAVSSWAFVSKLLVVLS